MEKSCKTCEFYIEKKCCGRNDIYGQKIEEPIKNCEDWEKSFGILQEEEGSVEAVIDKLLGNE